MAEAPILTLSGIKLSFGPQELFSDVELYVNRGDKIALVGRNGSGKSTLLKVIAGLQDADSGEIFIQPGTKIAYMPQTPDLSSYHSLKEVVLSGLPEEERTDEYRADILIEQFGIDADLSPQTASGGECRKAALAKTLIGEPDILLLDEPTNHLDMMTIEKLEEIVKNFSGAVIVISHDRMFLKNISQTTFWLDRGIMHRNNKGFQYFEEWQEQILDQEIIEQKHLNKKIDAETEWLHKGVTARRRRNMGRLRRLQKLREERRAQIKQTGSVKMEVEEAEGRSKLVIEAKHISKAFGQRQIVKDFSIKVMRGNKIGIVGPNGAGKTTLIKLLTKRLEPDSGFVRMGKNLEEAYFEQNLSDLDNKKTLWKTLCNEGDHIYVRGQYRHVVAYLKDFLFKAEQAQMPVGALIVSHDRDFLDRVVTSVIYMKGDGTVYEYPGSYSELEQKLKQDEGKKQSSTEKKPSTKSEPKTDNRSSKKTAKLSYKQQRALEILPQEIAQLEKQIAELETVLSDTELYNKDPQKFEQTLKALEEAKAAKENKENEWLEVELLKEDLENNK